jgi:transcriptional regulator with XRE-family HTH domain
MMSQQLSEPNVGQRIRALRQRRGLTQRALADACDLSANAVGLIERGETSPSVSTLHRLALALEVSLAELFSPPEATQAAVLVKRHQRSRVQREHVAMESLTEGPVDPCLEPFLATLQPGAGTGAEPVVHLGEEFVFCLEGEVEYTVAAHTYRLEAGDSLMFQAHQPHCWHNAGPAPARLLLVFHAADESQKWWRQHLAQ